MTVAAIPREVPAGSVRPGDLLIHGGHAGVVRGIRRWTADVGYQSIPMVTIEFDWRTGHGAYISYPEDREVPLA